MTPPLIKQGSPRPKLKSSALSQGDLGHQAINRELSISSGYGSSLNGSLSSLSSDVFIPEENTYPLKKCATLPRFDDVAEENAIPRSRSVTSMQQYKEELESAVNGRPSTGTKPASGKTSPIPAPRKISAHRRSPLAGSPSRSNDLKLSPRESSPEIECESGSDYSNGSETPRTQRSSEFQPVSPKEREDPVYRAMYTYVSQEEGEITMNEGDVVKVIQKGENGWWLLKSKKAGLGWGPSNYLQAVAY